MKITLLHKKVKNYLLIFSSLILLGAVPYFAGSGLDKPEPLGSYLNENFPAILPEGLPYEPVFPNITFESPLTFNEVPSTNKIIVGQRDGKIYWFEKTEYVSTKNMLLDLSEEVGVVWDGGFLGLTLHPKFGTTGNNYFYAWFTTEDAQSNDFPNDYTVQNCDNEEYWGNFLKLVRYEMNPKTLAVQRSSEQILLKLRMYGTTHRGGGLVFGNDGFLYLSTGDQTASKKAQDITNNLDGGVLRIDVDKNRNKSHAPVRTMPNNHGYTDEITGNGYWIPNDNPFLSPTGKNFEEYYSLGHRNPHRMTKDRATGTLYVGEIGGGSHEEINVIKKGKNYGFPLYEGLYKQTTCVPELLNGMEHEEPFTYFPRTEANSIIGGYVYRGSEIPELRGRYICADYGNGEEIWTIDINTGKYTQLGSFSSTNVISFGEDMQGELYILKEGISSLYKMVSKVNPPTRPMPILLSKTGAFKNLKTLEPTDGLIPYDLVESFWSDGALKKRWMGIPNNGTHNTTAEKIIYSENDVWNFPIGSVLIKHFEMPIDESNLSITKRLETRFSVKASDGNFYFATYKWNKQQTDAVLLSSGLDETINIKQTDGTTRKQTYTYPSNSDCISCHNTATGGTLGTRTRYLNKDFKYPNTGRTANQLVTLSNLGILNKVITDANTGSLLTSKAIDDPNATLDEKARSFLDLNCVSCHQPGTGNRGGFDLRLKLDLAETGLLVAAPYETLGIPNAKIVDPGNPSTSILYHRAGSTDRTVMMPPIAKNRVDTKAVNLINDWISQLSPDDNPCANRIIIETFDNIPGGSIAGLKNSPKFPNSPDRVNVLDEFNIPRNVADNYGVRVKGLLKAPETGTYYFWIAGDDHVELSISTNSNEANKLRIAYHDGFTNPDEWNKYPTQKSKGVKLVKGQNYYIEALMNESLAGENLVVGWRRPSDKNGLEPVEIIPCDVFDDFDGSLSVVNVTGVTLNNKALTLAPEEKSTLKATIAPINASNKTITWVSNNPSKATVNANGLVTAVANGVATITATTNDGNYKATTVVTIKTVTIAVTGIGLTPVSVNMEVGSTQALTTIVSPGNASNKAVTWKSSDIAIATVNSNGLVSGVKKGSATITVTTKDGNYTAKSSINVTSPTDTNTCNNRIIVETYSNIDGGSIAALKNNPNYPNTPSKVGELDQFSIPRDTGDKYGVRIKGLLKAPETGIYYFWIAGDDGVELSISTNASEGNKSRIAYHNYWTSYEEWNKYPTQKSIGIRMVEGRNYYIEALMSENLAGDNLSVGWRRPSDGNGNAPFEVIPCNVFDDFDGVSTVVDVTAVTLNNSALTIEVAKSKSLIASVLPSNASNKAVTWSSSNNTIATVNSNGLVKGIRKGSAIITVTTKDGNFTAKSSITVMEPTNNDPCANRIIVETYANIEGGSIAALKNDPNYPNAPNELGELNQFSIPRDTGDKYGVRIKGLLKAPESGTYYFWIAGDDSVELSISTNTSEAKKVRVAYHNWWTSYEEWNKYPTQKSVGITMVAGRNYYIEALMSENLAGDNLSVGWRKPSDGNNGLPVEVIPCDVFDSFDSAQVAVNLKGGIFNEGIDYENEPDFTFNPNPASSQITITVSNIVDNTEISYAIYTVSGSEVLHIKGGLTQIIDVSSIAKGSYFLVLSSDQWRASKNLIIK